MITVAPPLSASFMMILLSSFRFCKAFLSAVEMLLVLVLLLLSWFSSLNCVIFSTTRLSSLFVDLGGTKFDLFLTSDLFVVGCCVSLVLLKCSSRRTLRENSCRSASNSFLFSFGVGVNFNPRFSKLISMSVRCFEEMLMILGCIKTGVLVFDIVLASGMGS